MPAGSPLSPERCRCRCCQSPAGMGKDSPHFDQPAISGENAGIASRNRIASSRIRSSGLSASRSSGFSARNARIACSRVGPSRPRERKVRTAAALARFRFATRSIVFSLITEASASIFGSAVHASTFFPSAGAMQPSRAADRRRVGFGLRVPAADAPPMPLRLLQCPLPLIHALGDRHRRQLSTNHRRCSPPCASRDPLYDTSSPQSRPVGFIAGKTQFSGRSPSNLAALSVLPVIGCGPS